MLTKWQANYWKECIRCLKTMQWWQSTTRTQRLKTLLKNFKDLASISKKLSIVGREYHSEEHVIGYYNTCDRMKYWGKVGAFWGGLWGLLFGAAFFAIPGIGPVLIAGPLVSWIVGTLEGAIVVGGMSAIGAGLFSIGIPKDSVLKYETAIKGGKFLLLAHGTVDEVTRAKDIIQTTNPAELGLHDLKVEESVASKA